MSLTLLPREATTVGERASAMTEQLLAHRRLSARLSEPWNRVVVLERLARSGGATNWYYAETAAPVREIFSALRGGSRVSFYFGAGMRVEPFTEDAVDRMFEVVSHSGEIVVGVPAAGRVDFAVELPTAPSELAEFLVHVPHGSLVVWGPWPDVADDGEDAVTVTLVDSDGVLRAHPH